MLDRAFGPGQGIVSVDVLLNFDHVKVTSEEVLPARGSAQGSAPSGVMVRERQTQRETPAGAREGSDAANAGSGVTNIDVEYQAGRRIEQIVSTPGSVRRINVGVVVPRGLSPERLERIRELVAVAAGLDKQRGDAIAVYSLDQMSDGPPSLKPDKLRPLRQQGVPPVSSSPTSEPAWPATISATSQWRWSSCCWPLLAAEPSAPDRRTSTWRRPLALGRAGAGRNAAEPPQLA